VRAAGLNARPYDWSRDGKFLVYGREGETKRNLWLVGLDGDRKPAPYVEAPYNETMAQFSPDGKWMAYVSDESGQNQVYVRAIPPTRPPVQVSIAGGSAPTWRRDARELFYISADQKVTAVPIKIGTTFEPVHRSRFSISFLRAPLLLCCINPLRRQAVSDAGPTGRQSCRTDHRGAELAGWAEEMIGTSIGTYRITAKLGAGGMGEVYRARDTKLDRDVAIKILPESFATIPSASHDMSAKPKCSPR